MPRTGKSKQQSKKLQPAAKTELPPYRVYLSAAAKQSYAAYFDRAEKAKERGDLVNDHVKKLRMIDEVLTQIIPHDPINRKFALTGKLSSLFRAQKGRMRISWMASSERRHAIVVFISETLRKAGDANDPYHLLTNMMLSGEFDAIFAELGIAAPLKAKRIPLLTN